MNVLGLWQVNALRGVSCGDGVKRVVCKEKWECFWCIIVVGPFLGYFLIPNYKVVINGCIGWPWLWFKFILDDFWAWYKVVGMKRLFYETPWLCEKGVMQMGRGGLWVCDSVWCENGMICGEIKERACVHCLWLAKPVGNIAMPLSKYGYWWPTLYTHTALRLPLKDMVVTALHCISLNILLQWKIGSYVYIRE